MSNKKPIKVHAWKAETHQHYVEPEWCSTRLFQVEAFSGQVDDPCCGFGRIPRASIAAGHDTTSSDLVRRGYGGPAQDFLASTWWRDNIVFNPPFNAFQQFAEHALHLARDKVAAIWLVPRLNAAHHWLDRTPLARVWLLTPRPSMPPGHVITAALKPGARRRDKAMAGRGDFCWLVWEQGHYCQPELRWLKRDEAVE